MGTFLKQKQRNFFKISVVELETKPKPLAREEPHEYHQALSTGHNAAEQNHRTI